MKKDLSLTILMGLFVIFQINGINGQTKTVTYTSTSAIIPNPERGFYRSTETHSAQYEKLDPSTLKSFRSNNYTLILREFFMEDFIKTPISNEYISGMQEDFKQIRISGLKCIIRFAYSDDTNGALDASKSQILSHLTQIKPLLIANEDIIAFFQAGFIGTWGEWYYTDNFGNSDNPSATDYLNRRNVVDAILAALPSSRMVQIRTPTLKQKMYSTTTPLSSTQAFSTSSISRIGHHNDCFLASADDFGTYQDITKEYPYLAQETNYVPMGGETCGVNRPRSQCPTATSEMQKFHWTYLNYDYHPNVISEFKTGNCFTTIQNKLGYRFELINGTYPTSAKGGDQISIKINIVNSGYASIYNKRTVYLVLRNSSTNKEYSVALATDARRWTSGVQQSISETVTLPSTILTGTYKLYLNLPDASPSISTRPEYSIRLANEGIWESNTGYNNLLHTISIN